MNKTKTNNNSTTTTTSYSVPKDTLPLDVQQTCTDFSTALSSIEHLVRPLVSSTDKAGHLLHHSKELAPIEKAKLNLCYAYTVNTLLYMYLKTQGIDPNEHPMRDELKRVQEYIEKLRQHSAKFDALIKRDSCTTTATLAATTQQSKNQHTKFNKISKSDNNNSNNGSDTAVVVEDEAEDDENVRPIVMTVHVDKQTAQQFLQSSLSEVTKDTSQSALAAKGDQKKKKKQQQQQQQVKKREKSNSGNSEEDKSGESPKKRRRKHK